MERGIGISRDDLNWKIRIMSEEIFDCPEESCFYAQCLQEFLAGCCQASPVIHEFGSGDGTPMIQAVRNACYAGEVHGYEINDRSWSRAIDRIRNHRLDRRYVVHHVSFFDAGGKTPTGTLVANPPYLPAWSDRGLYLKGLYGGTDGSMVSRKLLSLAYPSVLMMVSSFSNPAGLLSYAAEQGYGVADFLIKPLRFGSYSSQPEVKSRIAELYEEGKAFYSDHCYLLAGVVFQKPPQGETELSADLLAVMQSIR